MLQPLSHLEILSVSQMDERCLFVFVVGSREVGWINDKISNSLDWGVDKGAKGLTQQFHA